MRALGCIDKLAARLSEMELGDFSTTPIMERKFHRNPEYQGEKTGPGPMLVRTEPEHRDVVSLFEAGEKAMATFKNSNLDEE